MPKTTYDVDEFRTDDKDCDVDKIVDDEDLGDDDRNDYMVLILLFNVDYDDSDVVDER